MLAVAAAGRLGPVDPIERLEGGEHVNCYIIIYVIIIPGAGCTLEWFICDKLQKKPGAGCTCLRSSSARGWSTDPPRCEQGDDAVREDSDEE